MAFVYGGNPVYALQSIPYKMNFQGRLTSSTGTVVADGTYNMKFRIYDAETGGNLLWSEQRANSSGTGVKITTGLFSTQLGDVTSLPPSIFNNAAPLYFDIELPTPATSTCVIAGCESYTEGTMGPRNKLGSSAYAFNSDTLDGYDSTSFGKLNVANLWTAQNTIQVDSASALSVKGSSGTGIFSVDTTANRATVTGLVANDISLNTMGSLFWNMYYDTAAGGRKYLAANTPGYGLYTDDTGFHFRSAPGGTAGGIATESQIFGISKTGQVVITPSTTSISTFMVYEPSGRDLFSVDSLNNHVQIGSGYADPEATVLVLANSTSAYEPTGTPGGMYYNTTMNAFRCYENGWRNCIGSSEAVATTTASQTVANTVTETAFSKNYLIPANGCSPGKVYRVTARGVYSTTTSAPTLTFRILAGTTQLASTGAVATTASMTNRQWVLNADVVCATSGTSGTVWASGNVFRTTAANGATSAANYRELSNTAAVTLDTTISQTLQLAVKWGTANAANSITLQQLIVQAL